MALRMAALNRAKDGRWFARKVIPEDVRQEYARLYGARREAHLKNAGYRFRFMRTRLASADAAEEIACAGAAGR